MQKFKDIFWFAPKSKIKAGEGLEKGRFPFYTSSAIQNKWINNEQHFDEALIFGTGGSASIHYESQPFSTSTDCFVTITTRKDVNTKYVYYFLSSNIHLVERGFKGAGLKHLSKAYLEQIEIPILDLETQNKIVAILDKAKAILEKREETLKKYDELLRATFLEMFGDVANNPRGFPKEPIKELGEVITGNTPPRSESENYDSNYIEWIKTDNILSDTHILTQASEYLSEAGFSKSRYVDENALLVTCIAGSIGSIGRSAITNRRLAFNQQINAIVPKENISVFFLYWMFKVSPEYIQSFATGGMKKLLTKGEFEKIPLIKPEYDLQVTFEQIAINYSSFKSKLVDYRNRGEELLRSLSQQVFSERITIDVDAELEALINAIDVEKKDEENKIDTITKDLTFLQRLMDKLQEQDFETVDQYEKAKYIAFRILKEEPDLIKQEFNKEEKKMMLKL